MAKHPFLSPGWIAAAREVHEEYLRRASPPTDAVRMNLVVVEVPFEEDQLHAHLDTSGGIVEIDLGHLEDADVQVSLDYATAKAILVDGDAQIALQAFLAGKIRVEGDLTKLLAFQAAPPSPTQAAVAAALQAITT
ncbi:MAG TPA: SCP2 sterol-binding domain-containing protein [Acidimicrobiales bacterium]|jgi:hypothetical protein|nr:SCP2 sterol-binding domain-containing protein [Acidimicrobiales bacterium]